MKKNEFDKVLIFVKDAELNLPSKIILKSSGEGFNFKRKITLKNNGGEWTHPNKTRLKVSLFEVNNTLGKPEVEVTLMDGSKIQMTFLDMAYLRDILTHTKDLGLNLFNDTVLSS
jgi:hypothetical protein